MKKKFYRLLDILGIYRKYTENPASIEYKLIRWNPLSWIYILLGTCFKFILYQVYGIFYSIVYLIKEFVKPNKITVVK